MPFQRSSWHNDVFDLVKKDPTISTDKIAELINRPKGLIQTALKRNGYRKIWTSREMRAAYFTQLREEFDEIEDDEAIAALDEVEERMEQVIENYKGKKK